MKYLIILAYIHITIVSLAQQTGKVSYRGMEFTIPDSWYGSETVEGYLIKKNGTNYHILVGIASLQNLSAVRQELNADLSEQPGISFRRSSGIETISGNALGAPFSMIGGDQPVHMYMAGITNNKGRGALVVALDQNGSYSTTYESACKKLAASLSFKEIETRNGSLNTTEKQYANTRLTYMESYYSGGYGDSYGAYQQKITIDLCGKGYFNYSDDFEMGGGGSASAFNNSDNQAGQGNWYIQIQQSRSTLILEFFNGERRQYNLERNSEGQTYLNGKRYYVSTTYDDAVYRPECF